MRRSSILVTMLVGCGGGSSTPIDAPIDVPPDVLIDAPPPPPGHHHYVIDSVLVPVTNQQAREYGQDVDNDTMVDNQFGMVLGTFSGMGADIQGTATTNVDRGASITLIDLYANDFTTEAAATFATFVGSAPMPAACAGSSDTTCRHHLAGSGTFTLLGGAPTNPALAGTFVAGTFTNTAGHLAVPFAMFPGAPAVAVNLIGAKVQLMAVTGTRITMAKIAGGIAQAELDAKVIPAMRDGYQAAVTRDCTALTSPPVCGCAAGSDGKTALDLFDSPPRDCHITSDEVKNNALMQSLLVPDVMIDGMQALSFGFKATAVEAGFVAP